MVAEHQLLTVREVAETMRVSTMTVYRLIRDGELPAIRVGKHFRLRTVDVDRYLSAQTVHPADPREAHDDDTPDAAPRESKPTEEHRWRAG